MNADEKRVFFGYEVLAPWPTECPSGRLIEPTSRHLTLAFLGNILFPPLRDILSEFPIPSFLVGPVGHFDRCLFLPERHPHVVAWHVQWYEKVLFDTYQQYVVKWLKSKQYPIDDRPFLSHVTMARSPFKEHEWKKAFAPLPMMVKNIHLYESVGNLVYQPIWTQPILSPFEELDHTADIAFVIQAESMENLHLHAMIALAFKFPSVLKYIEKVPLQSQLDDIIISLNQLIAEVDSDIGCPFKAVSFHGEVEKKNNVFQWEMIVDV
jgi:2'-5' RNA ligase